MPNSDLDMLHLYSIWRGTVRGIEITGGDLAVLTDDMYLNKTIVVALYEMARLHIFGV